MNALWSYHCEGCDTSMVFRSQADWQAWVDDHGCDGRAFR